MSKTRTGQDQCRRAATRCQAALIARAPQLAAFGGALARALADGRIDQDEARDLWALAFDAVVSGNPRLPRSVRALNELGEEPSEDHTPNETRLLVPVGEYLQLDQRIRDSRVAPPPQAKGKGKKGAA